MTIWQPGDRVLVELPRGGRGRGWYAGTVREVDTGSRPGVRVDLDVAVLGISDCYATHAELREMPERAGAMTSQLDLER